MCDREEPLECLDELYVCQTMENGSTKRPRPSGHFIKGPLPLAWFSKACLLHRTALATALALWYLSGLNKGKKDNLKVTSATLRRFRVSNRAAKYRALEALEKAGLIQVKREPGKNPLVTICEEAL